jgi:hypothetical protein
MFSDDQKWAGFPYFSRYSSHHLARLKKFYFSFLFFILSFGMEHAFHTKIVSHASLSFNMDLELIVMLAISTEL